MRQYLFNADDYGLTQSLSTGILQALQAGKLQSTSVMCASLDKQKYFAPLAHLNNKQIRVHLNLLEGKSLCSTETISSLVNSEGVFDKSLLYLWHKTSLTRGKQREKILEQIYAEFCAQIDCIYPKFSSKVFLDGHLHIHSLPGLIPVIEALIDRYPVAYIRTANETRYIPPVPLAQMPKCILRREILSHWSTPLTQLLKKKNIKTADYFIGAYASGQMTFATLKAGLAALPKQQNSPNMLVEIMVHPGYSSTNKEPWSKFSKYASAHTCKNHEIELQLLYDPRLADLFAQYKLSPISPNR